MNIAQLQEGRVRATHHLAGRVYLQIPLGVLAYGLALHWAYRDIIQPAFAYTGKLYSAPDPVLAVFTWIIATVVCAALPPRIDRPSAMVLWVLYVVTIAPTILMSTYLEILEPVNSVLVGLGFGVAFAVACILSRGNAPTKPLLKQRVSPTTFWIGVIVFSLIVYGYLAATAGLSLRLLSLFDVYDVREDYASTLSGAGVLGYLISSQANVINPLIIARGIYVRRWSLVVAGALGQAIIYSGTGFKTVLFSLPSLLIVALIFRQSAKPRALIFLWGAAGVVLLSALLDSLVESVVWSSLFARRFLMTPAGLPNYYVDYYSQAESFEMLQHSVLAPFFLHPTHAFGPARTVGNYISGTTEMSANANLFADGYAQFGWYGVAGIAILLAIFLRLVDSAAYGLPVAAASLITLMPAVALSNTSLLVALLSHGLIAMGVVLVFAPPDWKRGDSISPRPAYPEP